LSVTNQLGCVSVCPPWSTFSEPLRQFQLNWQTGRGHKNKWQVVWLGRQGGLICGFVRFL